jgi:GTP cyclohydrolase I
VASEERLTEAYSLVLDEIVPGRDWWDDHGIAATPGRAARALIEMTSGYGVDVDALFTTFDTNGYDEMIVVRDIPFVSLCEHHLLPFTGRAHVGYIASDRIVGLSKLARVVHAYARRLQVQERLTVQVADAVERNLDPVGSIVVVAAEHSCMSCRGVRVSGTTAVTSSVRGLMKDDELNVRLDAGNLMLFDSGIFWLTQNHMRNHPGVTMDEALALAPDEIDGFHDLWDVYVDTVREHEDRLWGYIELDQGGSVNKRKTRAKLEKLGLRPIPVYHPLNDGWDYFDELCSEYDRVCFGNIVQANSRTRKHLLATLWERKRRYPNVWVHVLGLTPNEVTTVYPVNSCDSSSWSYAIRYGAHNSPGAHAMGDAFGKFPTSFSYNTAWERDHPGGERRGVELLACEAFFMQAGIRAQQRDLRDVFDTTPWPKINRREGVRA